MNWNDELCGVKVTPESWAGGVVHWAGDDKIREGWAIAGSHVFPANTTHPHAFLAIGGWNYRCDLLTPIFPPRGWAGKTDAELWAAVATRNGRYLYSTSIPVDGEPPFYLRMDTYPGAKLELLSNGIWRCYPETGGFDDMDIAKIPDYILALQNAQVLARRLA